MAARSFMSTVQHDFADSSPAHAREALRYAVRELTDRGLTQGARWAQELLICVPRTEQVIEGHRSTYSNSTQHYATPSRGGTGVRSFPIHSTPALGSVVMHGSSRAGSSDSPHSPQPSAAGEDTSGRFPKPPPSPLAQSFAPHHDDDDDGDASTDSMAPPGSDQGSAHVHFAPSQDASRVASEHGDAGEMDSYDSDAYAFARSLFTGQQYERCIGILERRKVPGDKAAFLRLYAQFLIIERRIDGQTQHSSGPGPGAILMRPETSEALIRLLKHLIDPRDPFLLYLKGVILRKFGKRIEALDCFVRSIRAFPYCWSAWQELGVSLDPEGDEIEEISDMLPDSFMTAFFQDHYARKVMRHFKESCNLERLETLLVFFPECPYIISSMAHTYYHKRQFDQCEELWDQARELDPYCLEGVGDYSNALFVKDNFEKLAELTTSLVEVGRDSAEVCLVTANYHTSRGNHQRAVDALTRAVRLDPTLVSAWILLGHAYVELRNSHAATEMYRRALDIAPYDHRAWNGLGQTYELVETPLIALHYFQKACALDPFTPAMWQTMAQCYEKLGRTQHAISCWRRILTIGGRAVEQISAMKAIITLYDYAGDHVNAAQWHRKIVNMVDSTRQRDEPIPFNHHVESYIIAARWEMGDIGLREEEARSYGVDASIDDAASGPAAPSSVADGSSAMEVDESMVSTYPADTQQSAKRMPNMAMANEYLTRVIAAGTEHAAEAEELQKRLALLPGPGG